MSDSIPKSKRREGREAVVQFLYQCDIQAEDPPADLVARFWEMRTCSALGQEFARPLIDGVLAERKSIDARIKSATENYEFHRIAAVDRNILRLAVYEMFYREDIPPVVAINEAIEIAKRLGNDDSPRFVNGILDRLKNDTGRALRTAVPATPSAGK
jgi:N utilization substance protein B